MKSACRLLPVAIVMLCISTPAFAAKKGKRPRPSPEKKEPVDVSAIKPFDKDHNWEISLGEFEALQAAFKANPTGKLKEFDKGGDGALDPAVDRAAINARLAEAKRAEQPSAGKDRKRKKK